MTLTCGLTGYPRRRFAAATAVAAVIWAAQAFLIGRIGGRAFADDPWAALGVALGASVAISVLIEVVRRLRQRRMRGASAMEVAKAAESVTTTHECHGGATGVSRTRSG